MSDSLTTILVEPHQFPLHQSTLLTKSYESQGFFQNACNEKDWPVSDRSAMFVPWGGFWTKSLRFSLCPLPRLSAALATQATRYQNLQCCRRLSRWEMVGAIFHKLSLPKRCRAPSGCFIYVLGSSNSISLTFWTSQLAYSSRRN